MRAVLQRVSEASVSVNDKKIGSIGPGILALVSVEQEDTPADTKYIADKIAALRIFRDADGKMNLSVSDIGGEVLVISQFTLHGDCRRGRRPSFIAAAPPDKAIPLYEQVVTHLREKWMLHVATGEFGANMQVSLLNDGPVTLLLDSKKNF